MTANNNRFWLICLLIAWICLLPTPVIFAAEETPAVAPTKAEVIAAIKRRAQQILEARRKARELKLSGDVSALFGYESNPSNGSDHKGSTYAEKSLDLYLSKKLTPTLTWQGSYSGSYDKYFVYGDGDYTSQSLTPTKLTWQPGRMWRVEGAVDLNYTYYPRSSPSNYREFKPSVSVRQNLWGSWYQLAKYEWFIRGYNSKKARDGASAETLTPREDTRHRLRYEVGTTQWKTLIKAKNEWYLHDSNDARQDFYDAQDYKITGSVNRPLTEKLSANASYSFERKNYSHRQVTGITAESRYDSTQTWTLAGTYDFNDTWSFNPSLSYKFLDSNDPTGEYFDTTISGTLTARF